MPNVFAAVFHPPTLDNLARDATRRLTEMKVAIQQAYGALSTYAGMMQATNPFYIFAAPEYYFVKSSTGPANKPVWTLHTPGEKKSIFEELRALSGKYKRYLIAPGTLSWCQPRKTALQGRTYDGWNTAPVFYEGKLKHEYDKIFDDSCFSQYTADVVFQSGTKSQLFSVESFKFGIEICGDFEHGNLSSEARPESLDFEIMLSATNRHEFSEESIGKVPVKNGGYFIHSDSDNSNFCGAWCVQRGAGSHGVVIPSRINDPMRPLPTVYDPWTGRMLGSENLGQKLSVGTVLLIRSISSNLSGSLQERNDLRSSGSAPVLGATRQRTGSLPQISLPKVMPPPQTTQFRFQLTAQPVAPFFDSVSGNYSIEATVNLFKGVNDALLNKQVTFTAGNGTVRNGSQWTNGQGVAKAVFTGRKNNQPLKINATFNGLTATCEASIDHLGAGNVTKISRLKPETVISLWSYFLPI